MSHKKEPTYFSVTSVKSQQILMQFSLFDLTMNGTWRYELHPSHLINVATRPSESRKMKNVILHRKITKENCIKCILQLHRNGPAYIKFGELRSKSCTKQRLVTSVTCKNAWCKLGLTSNRTLLRLRLTSGATVWDHECMLLADTLNTCCEIIVHYRQHCAQRKPAGI